MTDSNRNEQDEYAGDTTESGTVDASSPEGERSDGSGGPDDTNERADTRNDALSFGSTAVGSPSAELGGDVPEGKPVGSTAEAHPDALIEGNRVARAEDME